MLSLTQALEHPDIEGVEYQHGTLKGYEVREYVLLKWNHQCAYCDARDVPLELDHVQPRSKHGSNRVSNLTLACTSCNQRKGNRDVREFLQDDPARLAASWHTGKRRCGMQQLSTPRAGPSTLGSRYWGYQWKVAVAA